MRSEFGRAVVAVAVAFLAAAPAGAQAPRKIGELELSLVGLSARLDPPNPAVPKNTAAGLRVIVTAGARELDATEVAVFLGSGFEVQAELSGPGLSSTLTLPGPEAPSVADPLILPLPAISTAGDYALENLRLVARGRPVLDVAPSRTMLKVLDQILVTSVKTRPLSLDEIRAKGIVLDSDDYLGFQFDLGLRLESKAVQLSFPVVFDRGGVAVPLPRPIGTEIRRSGVDVPPMTVVPGLLAALPVTGSIRQPELKLPSGEPIRIPSVLVIPGNVGYLKQFFSAQLFVANGAPVGSGLTVRDVTGRIHLPPGDDLEPDTADDPLALPETVRGPQPAVLPIRHVGPDGEPDTADDLGVLRPAEQGQAEFLVRGEREGFHKLDFDISATLDGLATGPVGVNGRASGGVLVRNPYFDLSFVVPSVVRAQEEFKLFVTVTNIGQGAANLLNLALDEAALSGAVLLEAPDPIDTLAAGDSRTVSFRLRSLRTGQVIASYLRFDTDSGASGDLRFRLGVGERGVPLSPDTLVLPTAVDALPQPVIDAAMRVLGQAWSAANAPGGLLPRGVIRPRADAVVTRALALAEAGLRVALGQPVEDAVADLATDLVVGEPSDAGFEQILFETDAGGELGTALGAAFSAHAATDALAFEQAAGRIRASAFDFLSFATEGPLAARLADARGVARDLAIPLGADASLGLSPAPVGPQTLTLEAAGAGSASLAVTVPRGDGKALRGTVSFETSAAGRGSLTIDPADPQRLELLWDDQGDGVAETRLTLATSVVVPSGPHLLAAAVIGPETLAGATPHGTQALALFDRPVSASAAADRARYEASGNAVRLARRQLSGRLVFISLEQPEGRFVEQVLTTVGLPDPRGNAGSAGSVALAARNADPGAIVNGRVLEADGTPLAALVTLANQVDTTCANAPAGAGIAATATDALGRYQFRYVRQDNCGFPFEVAVRDPNTGSLRRSATHVRFDGQVLAIDLVMLGTGSVSGVVRNLSGQPVPGARVVVLSQTDPQVSGSATTDGDGRFAIHGITVGAVNVSAAQGTGLGRATGRIDRAGQTASVDISIDSGSVRAEGIVRKLEGGAFTPASGALVIFNLFEPDSDEPLSVGFDTTDALGRYAIDNLPTGAYGMVAHFGGRTATAGGTASAGDVVQADLIVELDDGGTQYASVRGTVRLPDGSPAPRAIVRLFGSLNGAQAGGDGRYELRGLPVRPRIESIEAASADGTRRGTASVSVVAGGVDGVDVTLSGVGNAVFTALDPGGAPIAGLTVSRSAEACGTYEDARTDADGRVTFANVPLGSTRAVATRTTAAGTDFQVATASILRDGESGFGVMRFAGFGIVSGTVVDGAGVPLSGIQVALTSRAYSASECDFVSRVTHQATTEASGRFRFANVSVGAVVVVATDAYSGVRSTGRGTLATAGQDLALQIKLVDTTAGVLSGLILQPDGETPVGAGVEVSVDGPLPEVTVRTTADGRYAFARVLPQGRYTLTARDPQSGGRVRITVYLRAGLDSEQDLRLKGTGQVRVRVVDGADAPVERAQVVLRELDYPGGRQELAIEAASEGVALFDGVFEGPLAISVRDAFGRGGRASATLGRPGTVLDVKVRVTTTGTVTGVFRMPSGEPIPFGTVRLIGPAGANGQVTTDGVGDIGRFAFDFVPAGSFRLEAQDPLTARAGVAVGSIAAEGQVVEVDVRAEGLGRVQGVVTSNGAPEPGARVEVASGRYHAATMSDAAGLYDVEGVPVGRVVVSASLAGGFLRGTEAATLAADGDTLDLPVALRDSGRVVGQVVAPDGTPPGPPSQVAIRVGGTGGGGQSQASDLDGRFEFPQVAEGTASLSADVYGGIDRGRATAEVVGGETIEVAVPVNGVGALDVQVLDGSGQPTGGRLTVTGTGPFGWSYTVQVPTSGQYRFPELLAGPFTARVAIPAGLVTHYGSTGDVLAPGETKAVEVLVQPTATGTVIGRVVRADGTTPALGTQVSLLLSGNRKVIEQVQIDGSFDSPGLPLGALSLELQDPLTGGLARVSGLALVTAGQVLDVGTLVLDYSPPTITILDPTPGAVRKPLIGSITVAASDLGAGLDPASIEVEYPSRHRQPLPAPVDGVTSSALDPGRLLIGVNRLIVHARDRAGNAGRAEVSFTIEGSALHGVVRRPDGSPAAGIAVTVSPLFPGAPRPPRITAADGSFEEHGLRPGSWWAEAIDPDSGLLGSGATDVLDGEDASMTVTLPAYAHIVGVVRRADGSVAPGLPVTVARAGFPALSTVADAAGAFSFRNLVFDTWTVEAREPATGDRGRSIATLANLGATYPADVRLNGVGSVTVEVRDGVGAVVPGAAVTLVSSSPLAAPRFGTTDGAGRARFTGVLAGAIAVSAHDPVSGLDGSGNGGISDGDDITLAVSLEPVGRIVGTVRAALGGVVAGASVKLTGPRTATVTSAADGSFAFEAVPLGGFELEVSRPDGDFGSASGTLGLPGQTVTRDVTLAGFGTVSVLVLDGGGQPRSGALVTVSGAGPSRSGTTASDGRVTIANVRAGSINTGAQSGSLSAGKNGTLGAGQTLDVTLTLEALGTIQGRVLASDGITPVVGAFLTLVKSTSPVDDAVTAADGLFAFPGRTMGTYLIDVRVGGVLRARPTGLVLSEDGQVIDRDITLVPAGRVSGVVRLGTAPVAGADVRLASQHPALPQTLRTASAADGSYAFEGVPMAALTVTATASGGKWGTSAASLTAEGESLQVDIALLDSTVNLGAFGVDDGNGFGWGFGAAGNITGSVSCLSDAATLRVVREGVTTTFAGSGSTVATEENRHEVVLRQPIAGLDVTRKLFVPADGYFQRIVNRLSNPGPDPVTFDLLLEETASGTPALAATSSGDLVADTADRFVRLGFGSCGSRGLGTVFADAAGQGPSVVQLSAAGATRTLSLRWNQVTLAPGQEIAFMILRAPALDAGRTQASTERLAGLPPELFAGLLAEEAAAVANFALPADFASPLPALPLYGTVAGRVYGGDGQTPLTGVDVTFSGTSPHYGRKFTLANRTDAGFAFAHTTLAADDVVPREPFALSTTRSNPLGAYAASASGEFAREGVRDITRLPGGTLRASHFDGAPNGACCYVEYLTDGNPQTYWASSIATPRWLEATWVSPATVHAVVLHSASFGAGVRLDFHDASGAVIDSRPFGAQSGARVTLAVEPPVEGAFRMRLVDLAVTGSRILGEFQVLGEGDGVSARAEVDLVFRGTGVLKGVVRGASGAPMGSATVKLTRGTASWQFTTTASGAFQFLPLPPGPLTLSVRANGGFADVLETIEIPADGRLEHDVTFPPLAGISGTVRTAAGAPIQGAYVLLSRGAVSLGLASKQFGAYAFGGLADGTYAMTVYDSQRSNAAVQRQVVIENAMSRVEDFTLPPVGRVRATVRLNGQPLASAKVWAFPAAFGALDLTCIAASTGMCDVLNVAGTDVVVRAEYPGVSQSFATGSVTIGAEGAVAPITLDVPGVGTVSGTLRGRDGTPVVNSAAGMTLLGANGQAFTPTFGSNAAGAFSRPNVPVGVVRVQYRTFGWFAAETAGVLAAHGTTLAIDGLAPLGAVRRARQREIWELTLPAGKAAHAKVGGSTWSGLTSLSTGVVEVYAPDGTPIGTAAAGISFTSAIAGRYTVIARSSTTATGGYLIGSNLNDQDHTYRLPTLPSVSGIVRREGEASGPGGLTVRVVREGTVVATTATDAGGGYVFPLFTVGPYAVEVVESGAVTARAEDVAVEGPTQVHDLTLPALGTVRVQALRGSAPVPNLAISLASDHPDAVGAQRARVVTTDASGVATAPLAAGNVSARAFDPSGGAAVEASGSLAGGATLDLVLALRQPGANLDGRVLDVTGAPAIGVTVTLSRGGTSLATLATDAAGTFTFGSLAPGDYELVARAADGALARSGVRLADQADAFAELRFEADPLEREVALPYDLTIDPRYRFVVDRNGVVKTEPNSCDPFCSGFLVLGQRLLFDLDDETAVLTRGGRELILPPATVDGLELRRRVLVPEAGDWARMVFELRNPGTLPVTRFVALDDKHLSPGQPWQVASSTDGDAVFEAADAFVTLEQPSVPASPALAFVTQGPGPLPASGSYQEQDGTGWHWYGSAWSAVTVPAGGRVVFAAYLVQAPHGENAAVAVRAAQVAELDDAAALAGLDAGERTALVNFGAPADGSLSGFARDAGGAPLPGARVAVVDEAGQVVAETVAGPDGAYALGGLPPGSLRVVIEAGGQVGSAGVAVGAGAAATADVFLYGDGERGAVRVRAAHAIDGTPAAGQWVSLRADCCGSFWRPSAVLDAAGEALFTGVPAGIVRARLVDGSGAASVVVEAGEEALAAVAWQPTVSLPHDLGGAGEILDVVWNDMIVADADYSCQPWCGSYFRLDGQWGPAGEERPAKLRSSGREVERTTSPSTAGLNVSRRIFLAPSGHWVRVLEILENPGSTDAVVEAATEIWLGEDVGGFATDVLVTSDGDATLAPGDDYGLFGTGGVAGPIVGFVCAAGSGTRSTALSFTSFAEPTWQGSEPVAVWPLTVPAGGRRILATFVLQGARGDLAALQGRAEALRQGTDPEMLLGLSASDRQDLVNVRLP